MPTPDYISRLREKIGTELLLLPGVAGVVVDGEPGAERVLLGRRSDTGRWASVGGIVEPGEHPATCIVREIAEEVSVEAVVDRLVLVSTGPPITYPNGDRCQFVSNVFRCSWISGEPAVGDEESTDVGWFAVTDLPDVSEQERRRIMLALPRDAPPVIDQ
ncbi:NUDIX hydrolase [Microlunatus speluncae]|uniref:NUDIX hydrolase n=1 Tax=Microlunatus speluncae TaxID=2594267 RepID=UPI0012663E87|nr:NUDIX domain-containing protein [Microlunatus speluncae]